MQKIAFILIATLFSFAGLAQENQTEKQDTTKVAAPPAPGPYIAFEEKSHDFGDIEQGDIVSYVFEFENAGDAPLIISNVKVTCGCTTPFWPRDPIAPGEKSKIEARFNSANKLGRQNKVITVVSNAVNSPERVSIITNILPKAKEEAPK